MGIWNREEDGNKRSNGKQLCKDFMHTSNMKGKKMVYSVETNIYTVDIIKEYNENGRENKGYE